MSTPPLRPPPSEPSQGGWSEAGDPLPEEPGPAGHPGAERYVLGALLGRGGMGVVHAARDLALGRDVAIKELPPDLAHDPRAAARLAREAAITAALDHPGIVSVYDRGALPDGRPFYAMRLVRGRTLARAAAEAASPEDRRALVRFVLAAAEATAAAHDAGVVHRDLKPVNILIGVHGETQVVDWGLAAPIPSSAERWAHLPPGETRGAVGTPPYMAPEQLRGLPPDPRHDVWSLGQTLREVAGADPSTELQAIIDQATAALPGARYPHAGAFAEDLLRWFEGRRVNAHAYTAREVLQRLISAYRLPLGVALAGLSAVTVAVVAGWWNTTQSLQRALTAEAGSVLAEARARSSLADLRLEQAILATRVGARERAERLALDVLLEREDPRARGVFAAFGRSERPTFLAERPGPTCAWSALPDATREGLGEWVLCGEEDRVSRWEDGRRVWSAALRTGGGTIQGDTVLLTDDASLTIALSAATGAERGRWAVGTSRWHPLFGPRTVWTGSGPFTPPSPPPPNCANRLMVAAVSPTGALGVLCDDGTLLLGSLAAPATRRAPTEALGDHVAVSLAWTPDGRLIAGSLRGRLYVYSGDSGAPLAAITTDLGQIRAIRTTPDGRLMAAVGTQGGVGLWRLDTYAPLGEVPAGRDSAIRFRGETLQVHTDGLIRSWGMPKGTPARVQGTAGVADVSVTGDGAHLVTASGDGGVVTVDLRDGHTQRLELGRQVVKSAAYNPSGTALLATGIGAPYLAVGPGLPQAASPPGPDGWADVAAARRLRRVAWLDDVAFLGADLQGGLYRWTHRSMAPTVLAPERAFTDLEVDGARAVTVDSTGVIERWDGERAVVLATAPEARAVALRGDRLVAAGADAVDVYGAEGRRRLAAEGASLLDVALSSDGGRVAASSLDGTVYVWDVRSGALLGALPGHTERTVAVEFLPDGDLVSGSWDRSTRIWALGELTRPVADLSRDVERGWGPREDPSVGSGPAWDSLTGHAHVGPRSPP